MLFYFLHNSYEGFNVSQTGIQKLMAIVKTLYLKVSHQHRKDIIGIL